MDEAFLVRGLAASPDTLERWLERHTHSLQRAEHEIRSSFGIPPAQPARALNGWALVSTRDGAETWEKPGPADPRSVLRCNVQASEFRTWPARTESVIHDRDGNFLPDSP